MLLSRIRPIALSLAIAATVAACGGQPEAPEQGPGDVTVVTLKSETVGLTRELPGRTNAFLVAEVRPQVNGIVAKRLFTEGGMVKAGEPLYQIEDASYRAQANSARAQLARNGEPRARCAAILLRGQRIAVLLLNHATPSFRSQCRAGMRGRAGSIPDQPFWNLGRRG